MLRFLLLICLALAPSCAAKEPVRKSPDLPTRELTVDDKDYVIAKMPRALILVPTSIGAPVREVAVEVADNDIARQRGLMWREKLADSEGMIFVFDGESMQRFWMKNTLIPLDMVFIDSQMAIVGVVENAEPKSLASRGVDRPSKYVLELAGGYSKRYGLKVGSKVKLSGYP